MRFNKRAGIGASGSGGGGGGAGAGDEAKPPTPPRLPLAPPPTSSPSRDPITSSSPALHRPPPPLPPADRDKVSSSAGTSSGDGGSGVGAEPPASPRNPPSPTPTSSSRYPRTLPASPPLLQSPRSARCPADMDTDGGTANGNLREDGDDDEDEGPAGDYMPGDIESWNLERAEPEYHGGHVEEGELEDDADLWQLEEGKRVVDGGFRHLYDYPAALGFQACKHGGLGQTQDSQPGFHYSKIDEKDANTVRAIVLIQSVAASVFGFIAPMEESFVAVNLDMITAQSSFRHLIGRPLEQTVDDTCTIVSAAKCVEMQHRREYESRHGVGTFSCNAAAPRKLRKLCRLEKVWSHKTGACTVDVLKRIKRLGGVRTTNAPTPAPCFLPLRSWKVHRCYAGIGLSPEWVAHLLDTSGPFLATIWVSPWYHLFNAATDNDKVYNSGCARNQLLQSWSMCVFGEEKVGKHSVVCFEYRWCEGKLHVLILDNHGPTGPERWLHFNELEEIYTIRVRPLPRFHR